MVDVVLDAMGPGASFFLPLLALVPFLIYVYRRVWFWLALRQLPGPPALPILGNSLLLTAGQDGKSAQLQGRRQNISTYVTFATLLISGSEVFTPLPECPPRKIHVLI